MLLSHKSNYEFKPRFGHGVCDLKIYANYDPHVTVRAVIVTERVSTEGEIEAQDVNTSNGMNFIAKQLWDSGLRWDYFMQYIPAHGIPTVSTFDLVNRRGNKPHFVNPEQLYFVYFWGQDFYPEFDKLSWNYLEHIETMIGTKFPFWHSENSKYKALRS